MAAAKKMAIPKERTPLGSCGTHRSVCGKLSCDKCPKKVGLKKNLAIKKLRVGHRIFLQPDYAVGLSVSPASQRGIT